MSPLVSIIVPAYQAGQTLPDCLDSLLAQTHSHLQILVIDDGSGDDTFAIAQRYAARDSRVQPHQLPQNQGVSAARNLGLSLATGAYVGFCDADDTAHPTQFEKLLGAALAQDAQVAFCAVEKQRSTGLSYTPLPWPDGTAFSTEAIRADLVPQMISLPHDGEELPVSGYTPRNLFARSLLDGLRFREDLHYAEDLLFIVTALLRAERATMLSEALYTYRFRAGSKTQSYVPDLQRQYADCQGALEALFVQYGIAEALAPRMAIRKRRDALALCCNFCMPGTPFPPPARTQQILSLQCRKETRALFAQVRLSSLAPKLRVKYACMKWRWPAPLMWFYSYFYRSG